MRWHALVGLSVVGALIMAAGANAATVRVAITGSVTVAPVPTDTTPMAVDVNLAGVAGDLVFTGIGTSTGTLTVMLAAFPFAGATGPGAGLTTFNGDVSQGCVRVQGNRAIVIGHLPASEQFDIPFGHMEWVGTHLEDNGVATGTPVDRGRGIFLKTSSGINACNPANTGIWTFIAPVEPLSAGDASLGYADQLDAFPANPDTYVSVANPNGLSVSITDEADPDGLNVAVGAGSGSASLNACATGQTNVAAGSTVIVTCASLVIEVVTGSAEIVLGNGLTVISIPQGGKAEVAADGSGGFTVTNLGSVPLSVTVDGVVGTIAPGQTDTVETWDFQGFFGKVANPPVLNRAKAGQAVPLKWRLLDSSGVPVTDLATAVITVSDLNCETKAVSRPLEQGAAGSLQNLGDGYYQLDWKTMSSYAGTCKTMHLDIADGVTHDAFFTFTKK